MFPAPFVGKTLLSPLSDLGKLDKNQLVKIQGSDLFLKKNYFFGGPWSPSPHAGSSAWQTNSSLQHVASRSLARDWTSPPAPCIGSTESQPLDHQGSPSPGVFKSLGSFLGFAASQCVLWGGPFAL